MDIKTKILEKLRSFNIFQKDNTDSIDPVSLNPTVERTFKHICNVENKDDKDLALKN